MREARVCILNYGAGNVNSVQNAFRYLDVNVEVSNDNSKIRSATHLVLPGVGAFDASMRRIHREIDVSVMEEEVLSRKKPFLGICVGMQVLAEFGTENGQTEGLGWLEDSRVVENTREVLQPHVGWNSIKIVRHSSLLQDIPSDGDFYFTHSYVYQSNRVDSVAATTNYGTEFASVLAKDNIVGVQFHPEKSQKLGMQILTNFVEM